VITTALSAAFTALGIAQAGATPVFADVDPVTCNLDPSAAEAAIGPRTRAIMPVHLYGQPADMAAFTEMARRRRILLIEDAAQAHGARFDGRRTGTLADAATFSFYPTKNLGAYGDAGAVATGSAEVAEEVRMLRDGGQRTRYDHAVAGVNSRLDELQAAVLTVRLAHLDEDNRRRAVIAARYRLALAASEGLVPVGALERAESAHHLFVVRAANRDHAAAYLAARGVATAVHYPTPLHRQGAFEASGADLPHAEAAAAQVLSIPLYPELTEAEVDQIESALADYRLGALAPSERLALA
jgi:dTDP-4-amino-4,6-dideoxygalactose transaminase